MKTMTKKQSQQPKNEAPRELNDFECEMEAERLVACLRRTVVNVSAVQILCTAMATIVDASTGPDGKPVDWCKFLRSLLADAEEEARHLDPAMIEGIGPVLGEDADSDLDDEPANDI